MKKTIGKIYQSKIQHVGDGHYRFTLIGITSPKKASVIKYDIKFEQEEGKSKNKPPKIKLNLSKEFHKDCSLTINKTVLGDTYEITTPGEYPVIFDYHDSALKLLASPEVSYMDSALETIGKEVVEPYYGNEFLALGSTITDLLTGKLMTKNQLCQALNLQKTPKGSKNINLAGLISRVTSTLMAERNYITASDSGHFGTEYIIIVEEILKKFGKDKQYLETLPEYAQKLAENPTLVYEYLLNLKPEETVAFAKKIASLYENLRTFYITKGIGNNKIWEILLKKGKHLSDTRSTYEQTIPCGIDVKEDTLIITRSDAWDTPIFSVHQLTQTITEKRKLEGLRNVAKKILQKAPKCLKNAAAMSRRRRKND